jgi:hypothetical protein
VVPLTTLARKGVAWEWGDAQEEAISLLIASITSAPTLKHFDCKRETEIFTDASSYAIGGWLAQRYPDGLHPVFFWSRRMLSSEMAYPVHEQELLALVKMCSRAAHMLRGTKFVANTDHHALIYLQKQVNLSGRQVRIVIRHSTKIFHRETQYSGRLPNLKSNGNAEICGLWKGDSENDIHESHSAEFDAKDPEGTGDRRVGSNDH